MARRWEELKRKSFTAEQVARIERRVEAELLEMNLRGLREIVGKTQQDVAAVLDATQGQVSLTERRQDHLLSTLRRYVEALGGHLEVVADFGDKRIKLTGV